MLPREVEASLRCPATGLALTRRGDHFATEDGRRTYPLHEGIPVLVRAEDLPAEMREEGRWREGWRYGGGSGGKWALSHWSEGGFGDLLGEAPEAGALVLAFGSGACRERGRYEERGFRAVSFDVYPFAGADMVADGHRLPFADETFAAVTTFQVFEHLRRPWQAMAEIARVLRPGGRFLGSVAFMKPFHGSFFHMSHMGIAALMEDAGLRVEHLSGLQNPLAHTAGRVLRLGPRRWSLRAYDALWWGSLTAGRAVQRLVRRRDPDEARSDYGDFPLSYTDYRRLVLAPSVVFLGVKPV